MHRFNFASRSRLFSACAVLFIAGCECTPVNPNVGDSGTGGNGGGSEVGGGTGGSGNGIGGGSGQDDGGTINPTDPNNATKDSDCDGLSDQDEFSNIYAGGMRTNPGNPDTDGDGILDGVEAGRMTSVDPACVYAGDPDPLSRTNPTVVDSDADGIADGVEDTNKNGRAEPTETDPTNPDTDMDGLSDGVEDVNRNGVVDSGETDPRKRDTDGDFIADGIELNTTRTNPLLRDTDGDTCSDGAEDFNQNGTVDLGESDPNMAGDCGPSVNPDTDMDGLPNRIEDRNGNGVVDPGETDPALPDTDGDGLSDGIEDANRNGQRESNETNPLRRDTDCDGLLDGPTAGAVRGEDQNANGMVDPGETDPRRADSDADGVSDGVETGLITANIADPVNCMNVQVDADPTTTTNPTNADSDGDGINDGAEDTNQNGRVDPGELNPNDPADGVLPDGGVAPAGAVCTVMNLRPVLFKAEGDPDIQLGLPAGFTEVNTMSVGGVKKGLIGFDPTTNVAFIAWRQAAPTGATTPTADESALRPTLNGIGALTNTTTQTFTSWDNLPALQAFYDMAGGADLKERANAIADGMVGAGAGTLPGMAGLTGPFKMQVEYLHRTNAAVVVIVALTPLANYSGGALFNMSDTAGGSALAQFGDPNAYQCEVFAPGSGKVDFLFVVDDSCSMATYQNALASTAAAVQTQLANSTLDWRIALVSSAYAYGGNTLNQNVVRGFTRDINQFRSWLTTNSTCSGMVCSNVTGAMPACWGSGANNGCWVGTGGSGTERILESGARAMDTLTPVPAAGAPDVAGKFRNGAQVVVVLLGDADDQSTYNATQLSTFFGTLNATVGTRTNRIGPVPVHGIICPDNQTCGENQNTPRRNPAVITARGGIRGDITTPAAITNAVGLIINSAIASAGYRMQKPPIGASVKVAMDSVTDAAMCNKDNIPRSRADGFDFDGINRSLSFFGACRPGSGTTVAAVSYRYWIDTTPNAGGNPPPCSTDTTYYDPMDPDFCRGRLACDRATNTCECPADCGGNAPPGKVCDTNKLVCDFVCTSDCAGSCSQFQVCDVASCTCNCRQAASCPVGYTFQNSGGTCGCACDTAALNCGPTYTADPLSCSCACKSDCGGCAAGTTCNQSTCSCSGGIN
ncbi:MAG: adventurous gliding motility lipoprotein CglD [Archangium sp.]|nr:adventurous gliding motility lipoprotein CglD [Archangium sp.]